MAAICQKSLNFFIADGEDAVFIIGCDAAPGYRIRIEVLID